MLWQYINPVREGDEMPDKDDEEFLFNGWIKKDVFRISRKVKQAEFFLPIISGEIEKTSLGSIVFTVYKLFPATIMLASFWSLMTLLLFLYFLIVEEALTHAAVALFFCIANYLILIFNFNIQVRKSREILRKVFEVSPKE
jgi:hypothetical protein